MVASKLAKLPAHRPRQDADGEAEKAAHVPTSATQSQAAELLGVSERSLRNAKVVERTGTPELVEAVERGEIRVRPTAEDGHHAPTLLAETANTSRLPR